MTMRTLIIVGVVLVGTIGLLLTFVYLGGHVTPPDEAYNRAVGEAILRQVTGSHRGLVLAPETDLPTTVHVDRSLSMAGYAAKDSTFRKVIQVLAERGRSQLRAAHSVSAASANSTRSQSSFVETGVTDRNFFGERTNYRDTFNMSAAIRSFAALLATL